MVEVVGGSTGGYYLIGVGRIVEGARCKKVKACPRRQRDAGLGCSLAC